MRCEMKVKQQNDVIHCDNMNANIRIICQTKPGLVISNICRFKANATCTVQGVHQALSKTKPNIEVGHQQVLTRSDQPFSKNQPGFKQVDLSVKQIEPHETYSGL